MRILPAFILGVLVLFAFTPSPPDGSADRPLNGVSAGRGIGVEASSATTTVCDAAVEGDFWVLPPRLEARVARWLCREPRRRGEPDVIPQAGGGAGAGRPGTTGSGGFVPPADSPAEVPPGAISPYDGLIQARAAAHDMDWLLIAALISQESRFDPCRSSSAGAVGLAQVMPATALEMGITDPWEPGKNIEAGTRYLRRMYDAFPRMEDGERVAFALAAYTAGLGHVRDACSLAAVDGRDPARWSGNVEETMAQLANPVFAQRATYGGAHGHKAVAFVNLVLGRWRCYTEAARMESSPEPIPLP